jgi:hypothetical protein
MFLIDQAGPDDLRTVGEHIAALRGGLGGFDLVVARPADEPTIPRRDAGATWWLADIDPFTVRFEAVMALAAGGPPQPESR